MRQKHQNLIKALRGIHPCINEKDMQGALYNARSHNRLKNKEWILIQGELEQWAVDVGEWLRCMMRHVAQALLKPEPPEWAGFYTKPDKKTRSRGWEWIQK